LILGRRTHEVNADDELAAIIEKGKKSMKPDEIKAMVAYIRSLAK